MRVCVVLLGLLLFPAPVLAIGFERCTKEQIGFATAAVHGAREIALASAAAVGDTPQFARWFGTFQPDAADSVRAGMKAVDRALRRDDLRLICLLPGLDGCATDTYANVLADQPYRVNLCSAFFAQPSMQGIVPGSGEFDNVTREGTIIHEISHFEVVSGTEDHCYTRSVCPGMARTDPNLAIENADSFQYFAEDVVLTRQGRFD